MKWTKKLKRSVKELIGGKNTYITAKQKARIKMDSPKPKTKQTKRTRQVTSGLKQAGLTKEEIARLRGNK